MELLVTDPLVELLAIKLYEHDHHKWPSESTTPWVKLHEDDRQIYRDAALGKCTLGSAD